MLHTLKRKTVGIGAARHEPVNADFENMRNNLENVHKALTTALDDVAAAEASWKSVLSAMDHFSSGLHTLYPNEDAVRTLFKRSLDDVRGPIVADMAAVVEPGSSVRAIERTVRAYLTEIKTLHAEYAKLDDARRDFAMYQVKVEKLARRETSRGDDREQRNQDKLDDAKNTYAAVLDSTVHRMRSCYDKSPTMFRATYVAYWLYQSNMNAIVHKRLHGSFRFAEDHAASVFNMPPPPAAPDAKPDAKPRPPPNPKAPKAKHPPKQPAANGKA